MNHLGRAVAAAILALGLTGCGETSFRMADGDTLVWEEQRGDWVFINYWAKWCKPCHEEIPELNRLDEQSNVTVLGVNYDGEQGDSLSSLITEMGIEFQVFQSDPAGPFDWDRPVSLPATMVVNPRGELVEARFGKQSYEQLMGVVE